MKKFRLSGMGCSLADYLYAKIDFNSPQFRKYLSKQEGDGGLSPGHLVFTDDLEKFAGENFKRVLQEISGGRKPDAMNLGGPAIVAMINAAQIVPGMNFEADFYGATGQDETAEQIFSIIRKTPVNIDNYIKAEGTSPFTDVFSDPNFNDGKGERTWQA